MTPGITVCTIEDIGNLADVPHNAEQVCRLKPWQKRSEPSATAYKPNFAAPSSQHVRAAPELQNIYVVTLRAAGHFHGTLCCYDLHAASH